MSCHGKTAWVGVLPAEGGVPCLRCEVLTGSGAALCFSPAAYCPPAASCQISLIADCPRDFGGLEAAQPTQQLACIVQTSSVPHRTCAISGST